MAFDSETGEIISSLDHFSGALLDYETGECVGELENATIWTKKTRFNVPRFYLTKPAPRRKVKHCLDTKRTFTLSSKRRVMNLKEVISRSIKYNFDMKKNVNLYFPENNSRLQQNLASSLPDSITLPHSASGRHRDYDIRDYTSHLESSKESSQLES